MVTRELIGHASAAIGLIPNRPTAKPQWARLDSGHRAASVFPWLWVNNGLVKRSVRVRSSQPLRPVQYQLRSRHQIDKSLAPELDGLGRSDRQFLDRLTSAPGQKRK